MIITLFTKLFTAVYHLKQACICIVLRFYTALGGPSSFFTMVRRKTSEAFLLILVVSHFGLPACFFLASIMNVFYCKVTRVIVIVIVIYNHV